MAKNFKSVMIISSNEGFIVKGIETKLQEIGFDVQYCIDSIDALEIFRTTTDVYVLYLQKYPEVEVLVYLKDMLSEDDKKIIVIGEPDQYDKISNVLTEAYIYKWFDRPLDMNMFLKSVETNAFEEVKHIKKTILIVDDDILYMRMVYDWLKDTYRVGMASSGLQAIKWLAKNKADLILLDYKMPVLSGPQVLEMLKNDAETGKIPVMFLTGKNDKESLMSVINLKPVDYILKTIDKPCLLAKIKYYFDMQRIH